MSDKAEVEESPNFINLDELGGDVAVTVQLGGIKHEMRDMTVEDFVWVQKEAKKAEKRSASEDPDEAEVDKAIDVIIRQFPTMTKEMLKAAKFRQLMGLINFLNKMGSAGSEEAVASARKTDEELVQEEEGKVIPTK